MLLDTETASVPEIYSTMIRAITPRPIAWVSTISPAGVTNLAPFSFFSGVGSAPASLMFSVVNKKDGSQKDTMRNIEANKQFVVNVVPFGIAESMAITAGEFPYEESVSYTHLRAHETKANLVCRLLLEKKCPS